MTGRDLIASSLGNLGRHRVRTSLTVFGILVGILTLVSMVSVGVGVRAPAFNTRLLARIESGLVSCLRSEVN